MIVDFFSPKKKGRGNKPGTKTYLQSLAHATTDHEGLHALLDNFFEVSRLHSWRMLRVRGRKS